MKILEKNQPSAFCLVYGSACPDTGYAIVAYLKKAVEAEMAVSLDSRADSEPFGSPAILIGRTNRPESVKSLEGLAENEYILSFDGKTLVLSAKDPYGVKCAVRRFLDGWVKGREVCEIPDGYCEKGYYEIPEQIQILRRFRRGINVECNSYELALSRTPETFPMLVKAGFDHVRIPVTVPKFLDENLLLDPGKMQAIDRILNAALDAGLTVLLDLHYWDALTDVETVAPADIELFYSMWRQLAKRYRDYPARLCFQFLNEPQCRRGMTDELWNEWQMKVYDEVRAIDRDRILFFSPTEYSRPQRLSVMSVPDDDDFIAIDVHVYDPFFFTHQSVFDDKTYHPYTREVWEEFCQVVDIALAYRRETGIPMIVGEFSASPFLPEKDIAGFLSDVTSYMEQNRIAWTYWELDHYWAAYDSQKREWKDFRYGALMGNHKMFVK